MFTFILLLMCCVVLFVVLSISYVYCIYDYIFVHIYVCVMIICHTITLSKNVYSLFDKTSIFWQFDDIPFYLFFFFYIVTFFPTFLPPQPDLIAILILFPQVTPFCLFLFDNSKLLNIFFCLLYYTVLPTNNVKNWEPYF